MIRLENVSKIYKSKHNQVEAVTDFSFDFSNKKFVSIIGKSGSGKTTLMNLIGGIDQPTVGKIFLDNDNICNYDETKLAEYRNKNIGFVFQSFYLEPTFTVYENIILPLMIANDDNNREERANFILEKLDLLDKKNVKCNELSGGQKQRVCIARALINNPKVILADEPTGSLDSTNGKIVLDLLESISRDGKLVILITHNEDDAYLYSDTIIKMKDGKIVEVINNENKG